jgi:hypothetical protein
MRVGNSDSVSQWFLIARPRASLDAAIARTREAGYAMTRVPMGRRGTDRYRFDRGRSMVVQFG